MNKSITIMMKTIFTALIIGFTAWQSAFADTEQINVYVGEIKILQVGDIDRVAVGNSSLLSTSMLDNGQLLLLAEAVGETSVHLWFTNGKESDFKVTVQANDADRIMQEVQALVDNLGDIKVKKVGDRIYLTGSLYKSEEEALKVVKEAYKEVLDLTRKEETPPEPVSLPEDKMVNMDVKFTELRKNFDKNLGISWSNVLSGPLAAVNYDAESNRAFRALDPDNAPSFTAGLPAAISGPLGFFGLATQISSTINLLVANGDAIILAQPKLSARSGGKAEFLAGGEVPVITTTGVGTVDVEYKEFGIKLEVEPIVDKDNNIVAKIMTESSTIDPDRAGSTNSPPGFITRKTSTDVRVKDGETLVLSGLIDRRLSENVSKLPFLGDIPIIGSFFRNRLVDDTDNELVIFVTPTVFDADSDYNRDRLKRHEEMIEEYKESVGRDNLIVD